MEAGAKLEGVRAPQFTLRRFFWLFAGLSIALACFKMSRVFAPTLTYRAQLASTAFDVVAILVLCFLGGSLLGSFTPLFRGVRQITGCFLAVTMNLVMFTHWAGKAYWRPFDFELPVVTQWALSSYQFPLIITLSLIAVTVTTNIVYQDPAAHERWNVTAAKLVFCVVTSQIMSALLPFIVILENM